MELEDVLERIEEAEEVEKTKIFVDSLSRKDPLCNLTFIPRSEFTCKRKDDIVEIFKKYKKIYVIDIFRHPSATPEYLELRLNKGEVDRRYFCSSQLCWSPWEESRFEDVYHMVGYLEGGSVFTLVGNVFSSEELEEKLTALRDLVEEKV